MFELVMSKGVVLFFSSFMIYIILLFFIMEAYGELKKILDKKNREVKVGRVAIFVLSTPLMAVIYIAMKAFVDFGNFN